MNIELLFLLKIVRNSLILGSLYFLSVWASTLSIDFFIHIKPVLIFAFTYILVELAKRYNLDYKRTKEEECLRTLVL